MSSVCRASGHCERFSDMMVKDLTTGEFFRADHLLEEALQKLLTSSKCSPEQRKEYEDMLRQVSPFTDGPTLTPASCRLRVSVARSWEPN